MSDRIRVRKDDELVGWVDLVGVHARTTDGGLVNVEDEWVATRQRSDEGPQMVKRTFVSRETAIGWLLRDES